MANYNYTVTVAYSSFYGGNVYSLNGTEKPALNFVPGDTVTFDLGDSSTATHPLVLGPDLQNTSTAYGSSDGVTYTVTGTTYNDYASYSSAFSTAKGSNASAAVSITWVVASGNDLSSYYFCGVHSGMGNTATVTGGTDTDAPTNGSITIDSGAASTTSTSVTLALSANDVVGVNGYYVSETNSTPLVGDFTAVSATTSYSDNSVAFTLSAGVGTKTVYAWFKDTSDNISTPVSDTISLVSTDTLPPTNTSISLAGGATSTSTQSITVDLAATDDVGVDGYYLSETNSTPAAGSFTAISPAVLSYSDTVNFSLSAGDGLKTVYAWFKDAANNISIVTSDTITLALPDTVSPASAAITLAGGAATSVTYQTTATISGTDAVGITGYYLSETNSTPALGAFTSVSSTTSFSETVNFTLSAPDGIKTVYLWLRDAAGNISASANDDITLDTSGSGGADIIAPVISSMTILQSSPVSSRSITVRIAGSDAVGVAGYYLSESITTPTAGQFTLFSGTYPTSFTEDITFVLSSTQGDKTVYAWLLDAAGNISTPANATINLASSGSGEGNFKIRESLLQSSLPGFATARTMALNTNTLAFGPLQVSNTVTINGTFAVFNDLDIVENGIVNVVGTLDLR